MPQLVAQVRASLGALVKETRAQQFLLGAGVLAIALTSLYGAGWRARGAHDRAEAYRTARQQIVDTITIVKKELVHDTILVHDTKVAMDSARARFATNDVRIRIIGDTALSIDNGPAFTTVPAISVIPEIDNARITIGVDSVAYKALVTKLKHETKRGDLEARRADLAEGELHKASGRKLGFKSGLAVGAVLLAGAKLLLKRL